MTIQNENTVVSPQYLYPQELSATATIFSSAGIYKPTGDDYVARFRRLVRQWRAATLYSSSGRECIEHPKFREILGMGDKILPLIIEEITVQPDPLIAALPILTGADPVTDRERGNFAAMATVWIEWFNNR